MAQPIERGVMVQCEFFPHDSFAMAALGALATLLLLSGACAHNAPPVHIHNHGWEDAAQIAITHEQARGQLRSVTPVLGTRYLFLVPWRGDETLLVHRGRIWRGRGMAAFGRYLRDIGFVYTRRLQLKAFIALWVHFVRPSNNSEKVDSPTKNFERGTFGSMKPELTFDRNGAVLRLTYRRKKLSYSQVQADEWTLHISKTYRLRWTKRCTKHTTRYGSATDKAQPCDRDLAEPKSTNPNTFESDPFDD